MLLLFLLPLGRTRDSLRVDEDDGGVVLGPAERLRPGDPGLVLHVVLKDGVVVGVVEVVASHDEESSVERHRAKLDDGLRQGWTRPPSQVPQAEHFHRQAIGGSPWYCD